MVGSVYMKSEHSNALSPSARFKLSFLLLYEKNEGDADALTCVLHYLGDTLRFIVCHE